MTQQTVPFPLEGGLDRATPALKMPPGRCIAANNYEPTAQGYRRLTGYERYDGRTAPSAASAYTLVYDDNGTGNNVLQFALNDPIRDTSGGTIIGYAAAAATLVSGAWGTSTAVGSVTIWPLNNSITAFTDNNDIWVGTTRYGYQQGSLALLSTSAAQLLAAAQARALIATVTGSGPVRAVFPYEGVINAIRDNGGGTAALIYYASTVGWAARTLGYQATFNNGGIDGQSLVEGSNYDNVSGAGGTATPVPRFTVTAGSWAAGNAQGYLWTATNPWSSGDYLYHNTANTTSRVCRISATPTAVDFPAGGTYEMLHHNFYGASDLSRTYIVSGLGAAAEINDTVVASILTGMTNDKPTHIAEHNGALALSFPGGSIQLSAVGNPLSFSPVLGASEIAVGSDVTALIPANKSTTAILAEESVSVLYGHDQSDYLLETLTDEAGGIARSAQRIGGVVYLDNGGLRSLTATAATGGFNFGSISQLISPLLAAKRAAGTDPACSFVLRKRNQYWLLFEDGTGIVGCFSKKNPEFLPITLGFTPTCSCSVEIDGVERIFVGGSDGYVYEFDKGTTFDGSVISHYVELAWHHFGAPQQDKRGHKFSLDLEASGTTTLSATARFDNGASALDATTIAITNGSGDLDSAEVYIDGVFRNISMKIAGSTTGEEPHTLTGATYHITPRRLLR